MGDEELNDKNEDEDDDEEEVESFILVEVAAVGSLGVLLAINRLVKKAPRTYLGVPSLILLLLVEVVESEEELDILLIIDDRNRLFNTDLIFN